MENIRIEKLTTINSEAVFEYMRTQFAPDEPLFRTTQLWVGDSFFDKLLLGEVRKKFVTKPIESGDSFGAFDSSGNLLGVRLGFISDRSSLSWEPSLTWMLNLPEFFMSDKWLKTLHVAKFIEEVEYKEDYGFDHCLDNNGKIYFGLAVGVTRDGRGQGLGGRLLKKSIDHAKDQGCSHMYLLATGKYSQKIMKNHGFCIIKEKDYDSYKDHQGRCVIKDDVHKSAQVVALKIE